MSDVPASGDLDLRAALAQIDRAQVETRKLLAEQTKLTEEALKFAAGQRKLSSEADKFNRDRWMAPWTLIVAVIAALLAALPTFRALLARP